MSGIKPVQMPKAVQRSASWALSALDSAVRQNVDAALSRTTDDIGGLSLRDYWLLEAIANNSFSQRELCDLLRIDRSDMVRLIDALEKVNLVVRTRDTKDRRRQLITLTDNGDAVRNNLRRNIRRAENSAVAELPPELVAVIAELLAQSEETADASDAPQKSKKKKKKKKVGK